MLERKNIIDLLIVVMTTAMVALIMCGVHQASYQSGFNSARSLVENSNLGAAMRTPDDIRVLPGTVTAVGADRIAVHTVSNNPFDSLSDRTALITSATKITKFTQKDPAVFKTEMDAYIKAAKSAPKDAPATTPPGLFAITTITPADIKVGDAVMVTAAENIKTLRTFTASFIQVQVLPAQPSTQ